MSIEELDSNELLYTLLDCIGEYRHFMRLVDNWDMVDIDEVGHFMVSQYRYGRVEAVRSFNLKNEKR